MLLMNKRTDQINICTVGGGNGMPVINNSLVGAGFRNISSIVTTFDSGGDSGRIRTDERGRIMAFSDYWRSLISLWKDGGQKEIWEEMLRFRDGRGRNFGNIFFQFMSEKSGSLTAVDELFVKLTGADLKGKVMPVVLKSTNVHFKTKMGKEYIGEHMLDELRMSDDQVVKLWLEPRIKANPEVIESIDNADVIIICPGSMHGSLISTLLPTGIRESLIKSKAKKMLITNIMSMANENNGFDQKKYVETFEKYLGKKVIFDWVVMADLGKLDQTLLQKTLKFYEMEHSFPIKFNPDFDEIKTILADIAVVELKNMRLRHSEIKMANLFKSLLE